MLEAVSRIRVIDRMSDELIVYDSDNYVCLMKLFPMCQYKGDDISEEDYRRFHLRFYIPREYFSDARKQIDKIVVMTDGLDEFSHYTLYDELGSRFASQGVAAVLLPLPDHLNRHTRFRIGNPTAKQITEKPSAILMREPIKLYLRYLQFKGELAQLHGHFNGNSCKKPGGPCKFYRHLFAPNVRISYLGYSLGAAAMLSDFLESESDLNACFLLNGAIKLRDIISGAMIPQEEWNAFTRRLEDDFKKHANHRRSKMDLTNRLFEEIFLGQFINVSKDLLRKHGHRVFFIFGGKDHITSYKTLEAIAPDSWGSGMLVLPGINHFLGIDEEWRKWMALVVNLISDFEENAVRRTITRQELHRQNKLLNGNSRNIPKPELKEIEGQHYRAGFIGMDPELIADQEEEKERIKTIVSSSEFEKLPLGLMLYQSRMISVQELTRALELQSIHKKRIGDIFVEILGIANREHVEALVSAQRREH